MGYLEFASLQGNPIVASSDVEPVPAPARTGLSALEWQVVAIAQRDRLSTLSEPGRLAVALGMIFGGERANPRLADPRLEALRRLAVLAWHKGYTLPPSEVRAFHDAGFTTEQYETLLASISRGRAALNQGTRHEHDRTH
ncbi:hypothetical protein [Sphingomonas hengshuiensis]|uniref:Uncharacterized protein n=1 Tax=Sphingomonas hengshuiensis TaxID=1609977 RepID=A0A7U4J7T2_9SPHN|nr:hypothetical protein [Sphingomonas hengshuiensis]AJP71798.1 hypothetical protein TS85_08385 [Sphingomonas hengshuiensis]